MPKSDREILAQYIPQIVVASVLNIIHENNINLKIKKARASKLGDFRAPTGSQPARLSINANLNTYAFLITLIHEIAHWLVWENYKNSRYLQPHGIEWKRTFQGLMHPYLNSDVFPEKLLAVLQHHMQNPKASSTSDIRLSQEIKEYDTGERQLILADLDIGKIFLLKAKQFQIIEKKRSRFLCQELNTGKRFLIHSLAEINTVG